MHLPRPTPFRLAPPARPAWPACGAAVPAGLLAAALALAGCAPALDWRTVRPEGSGLQLAFPCKPSRIARDVRLAGATVPLALHACRADDVTWALAWADLQDPARVGPALAELRASAAANVGAPAGRPLPLQVPGSTPQPAAARLALEGRMPDGRAAVEQVAVFAHGTRVYQATALAERAAEEAMDTFFASLRVGP